MQPEHNTNHTIPEIQKELDIFKQCIKDGKYQISLNANREENRQFIEYYQLNEYKREEILNSIDVMDFCYSVKNDNNDPRYCEEILYIFCPQKALINIDDVEELVDIYIKINPIEYSKGKRIIIVSFHKRNRPIDYCFK